MKISRAIIIVSTLAFLPAPTVHAQISYNPIQQQATQGDQLAADLLQWLDAVRDQNPSFKSIQHVVSNHPDWPLQGDLKQKADRTIVKGSVSNQDILAWYGINSPKTDRAKLIYLEKLAAAQSGEKFTSLLKKYWRGGAFDTRGQETVLNKWGGSFNQDDHYARADALIDQGKIERAEMAVGYVTSMAEKNVLATRLLLLTSKPAGESAYKSLTTAQKKTPAMTYARLKYLRDAKKNDQAAVFLSQNETTPVGYEKKWWRERHILARRALEDKRYEDAYYLAADHGFDEGLPMADGEWLSGWVALTYLDRADLAFGHFDTMYKKVKTPISKARAGYGAGLASQKLGEAAIAKRWFEVSGTHTHTFYGQKSLEELGTKQQTLKMALAQKTGADALNEIVPSAGKMSALNDYSAFRAAEYLHNAGFEKERDLFLLSLVWKIKDQDQLLALLNVSQTMKSQTTVLSIGKRLQQKGVTDWNALFPDLDISLDPSVDRALTHAIIRQESIFNPNIESHAGAKGLMQLMPATAKQEAIKLGIAHDTAWLFSKPEHNVRLGQSYLSRMLDRYDGSLPLAVAAYNAGPGNVDKWLTSIGDPRQMDDDLQWMEKIPFKETRNYVQRVLESYTVYQNK